MPVSPRIVRALPTNRILWAGLVVSNLLLAVMAFKMERPEASPPENIWIVMTLVATAAAVASFVGPEGEP